MSRRPRLLDAFCGAGGMAYGYHLAGWDVVGVDIEPQPEFPFEFHRGDALEFIARHGREFDAVSASPPCQRYCAWQNIAAARGGAAGDAHPDLVGPTRDALEACGRPWVIENVVGAPLRGPVLLCGTMFGLNVRRHRHFESSELILQPNRCRHTGREIGVYGKLDGRRLYTRSDGSEQRAASTLAEAREAMGIGWMSWPRLTQAIPPAYSAFIGRQLMAAASAGMADGSALQ